MPGPAAEFIRVGKQVFEIVNLPDDVRCTVCGAALQQGEDEKAWVRLHRAEPEVLPKRLLRLSRRRFPSSC